MKRIICILLLIIYSIMLADDPLIYRLLDREQDRLIQHNKILENILNNMQRNEAVERRDSWKRKERQKIEAKNFVLTCLLDISKIEDETKRKELCEFWLQHINGHEKLDEQGNLIEKLQPDELFDGERTAYNFIILILLHDDHNTGTDLIQYIIETNNALLNELQ